MVAFVFSWRSRKMLEGVHPDLILVVSRGLLYSFLDFAVVEGMRSQERQDELHAAGLSRTQHGKHLRQPDGFAHAIDIMAVGDLDGDGMTRPSDQLLVWDPDVYATIADGMKRAALEMQIGIRWGGDFKNFFDGPHFELV